MELAFNADEHDLFDTFEQFFSRESPPSVARAAEPLGFDAGLWRKLDAMEVWGSQATLANLCVIAEVAGRWIAPVPFGEHAVASRALGLATAERIATVAVRPSHDGLWRLVPAGAVAGVVIGEHDGTVVVVASAPPGQGPLNHAAAPIADRSVDRPNVVAADICHVLAEWKLLTAAALVGIGARSLEMAVDYVKARHQFGVPIGSFQSVQHGLAELPGLIDGARLLVHEAAAALDDRVAGHVDPGQGDRGCVDTGNNEFDDPFALAAMAFLFATDVAVQATDRALHFHGGYGFAEEADIQLYYRRARGWPLILGDPAQEHLALADIFWPATAVD